MMPNRTQATLQSSEERALQTTDQIESPVFLVGSERSGTTLFRLMLDHHPQIAFFFEFEYAVAMMSPTGSSPIWTSTTGTSKRIGSSGRRVWRSTGRSIIRT